jgi:signal transduction histidine kinase
MSEERGGPWERLAGAFRRRQIRDVMELDRRGRLGEPPRPGLLAFATFVLVGALGFLTFAVGRVEEDTIYLVIAAIGVFGLAISIGSAMTIAQYRTQQQLDEARSELLATHAELALVHREMSDSLHDARAMTAALGASVHTLEAAGTDPALIDTLAQQVSQLRKVLTPVPPQVAPSTLGELLEGVRPFAAAHGLALEVTADPDAGVRADTKRVTQILTNLIDNARKYAPGSPVYVSTRPAGPYVHLLIEDAGPGIHGNAGTLFEPGARTDAAAPGLGIGLAAARRMAEEMGGALWYEQRPGGGSRFVLRLVAAQSAGPEPGEEP